MIYPQKSRIIRYHMCCVFILLEGKKFRGMHIQYIEYCTCNTRIQSRCSSIRILLTLFCPSPQSTAHIFHRSLKSGSSNTLYRLFLTARQKCTCQSSKGQNRPQVLRGGRGESMNRQRRNFPSLQRPNQTAGALVHCPVKASAGLKMGYCF